MAHRIHVGTGPWHDRGLYQLLAVTPDDTTPADPIWLLDPGQTQDPHEDNPRVPAFFERADGCTRYVRRDLRGAIPGEPAEVVGNVPMYFAD